MSNFISGLAYSKETFMSMIKTKKKDEEQLRIINQLFKVTPRVVMMFASPLVRFDNNIMKKEYKVIPMQLTDFDTEFENAFKGLRESKIQIEVKTVCGTVQNFLNALKDNPHGLHVSCHAVPNKVENIGTQNTRLCSKENGEYCLVFETEEGAAHYVTEL